MAPWPMAARRENALPRLNRRHNREHQVPESEAELLALDCWPRWRRGGEFVRRLRWRLVASWLRAGGEASMREQESGRDGVERSATWSVGVGRHVGADAGRLRCTAASTAHGRHAAGVLCRGRNSERERARRVRRQARRARGWARPRRSARRCGRLAGPASTVGRETRRRPTK